MHVTNKDAPRLIEEEKEIHNKTLETQFITLYHYPELITVTF